jgi:pyruvate/2-oxoglutarate dehydrogenase complex dihydrolipoamide acyltransferase (E2) component
MPHNVIMPKTGMAMEEGTIVRWLKAVGDTVRMGEAIAVIETDKVTMDLESDFEGTPTVNLAGNAALGGALAAAFLASIRSSLENCWSLVV